MTKVMKKRTTAWLVSQDVSFSNIWLVGFFSFRRAVIHVTPGDFFFTCSNKQVYRHPINAPLHLPVYRNSPFYLSFWQKRNDQCGFRVFHWAPFTPQSVYMMRLTVYVGIQHCHLEVPVVTAHLCFKVAGAVLCIIFFFSNITKLTESQLHYSFALNVCFAIFPAFKERTIDFLFLSRSGSSTSLPSWITHCQIQMANHLCTQWRGADLEALLQHMLASDTALIFSVLLGAALLRWWHSLSGIHGEIVPFLSGS